MACVFYFFLSTFTVSSAFRHARVSAILNKQKGNTCCEFLPSLPPRVLRGAAYYCLSLIHHFHLLCKPLQSGSCPPGRKRSHLNCDNHLKVKFKVTFQFNGHLLYLTLSISSPSPKLSRPCVLWHTFHVLLTLLNFSSVFFIISKLSPLLHIGWPKACGCISELSLLFAHYFASLCSKTHEILNPLSL